MRTIFGLTQVLEIKSGSYRFHEVGFLFWEKGAKRFLFRFRNMAEKKRKALSLKQKIDLIRAVESNPNKNKNAIAEVFNVPRTTLLNILREKAKYLHQFESGKHDISRRCDRRSSQDTLDKALLEWFTEKR